MLIVIEGDNGTGKDTIANFFVAKGFHIVTWDSVVKEKERFARTFTGLQGTNAFLDYTLFCEETACKYQNALIIRSWISTLSAAYADNRMSFEDVMSKIVELIKNRAKPNFVFFLHCDFSNRIERINARNPNSNDDKTIERASRYDEISKKIGKLLPYWHCIETSNKSPEQVFQEVWNIIANATEGK